MKVEYFFAAGCSRCAAAREELRLAAESFPGVRWSEVDVAKEPARAVDVGVVATPALVIDGELAFGSAPSPAQLRAAIGKRVGGG